MAFVDALCYSFPESLGATKWMCRCCPRVVGAFFGDSYKDSIDRLRFSSQWISTPMPGEDTAVGGGTSHSWWRRALVSDSSQAISNPVLHSHSIFLTTFDMACEPLPKNNLLLSVLSRNLLAEGLEHWIPAGRYHIYAIAVQRSTDFLHLREAVHKQLGGNAKFSLVATAELNDATHASKSALMLFVRTVDVESGAFRLIGVNERPIRATCTGTKGLLGLSFRFYDQSIAVINAHLPERDQYSYDDDYRARHVAAMLRKLRLNGEHELFDTHLQYHHVFLLGNLNYRTRGHSPSEVLSKVVESAVACQSMLERVSRPGMDCNWRAVGYSRFWSAESQGTASLPLIPRGPLWETRHGNEEWKEGEGLRQGDEESRLACVELGVRSMEHQTVQSLMDVVVRAWSWVKHVDTLISSIQKGLMLHGFGECPIVFPPTYKWNKAAYGEDFIIPSVVEKAYVTQETKRPWIDLTPSYTDRILYRSTPGVSHRLLPLAYDALERGPLAIISDHRPVSAAFSLLLNTAHPLALYLGQFSPLTATNIEQGSVDGADTFWEYGESSEIARAMAKAAIVRQVGRPVSSPRYMRPSSHRSSFPPLLITVCLSNFSFQFMGFKNVDFFRRRDRPRTEGSRNTNSHCCFYGFRPDSERHASENQQEHAGGNLPSRPALPGDFAQDTKDGGAGRQESLPETREHVSNAGGNAPPPSRHNLPERQSNSSRVSWMSDTPEENESGREGGPAFMEDMGTDTAVNLVEEIVLLYPLPCEDPLWRLRHHQALDESLRVHEECSAASHRTSGEQMLRNLHTMRWQPELEARDKLTRTREEGTGHFEVDILTFGPLPMTQHALIKFMGSHKRELGQGVMCVRNDLIQDCTPPSKRDEAPGEKTSPSEFLTCRSRENLPVVGGEGRSVTGGYSFSSPFSTAASDSTLPQVLYSDEKKRMTPSAANRQKGKSPDRKLQRQRVPLSVGGDYRGVVEFLCEVKARRRTRDGARLQVPRGKPQSS